MTSSRRSRNYKEKRPMLAFGHFILPIATVVALGMLFVGIKLFFLSPAPQENNVTYAVPETDDGTCGDYAPAETLSPDAPRQPETVQKNSVVLAVPVDPEKEDRKKETPKTAVTPKPAAKPVKTEKPDKPDKTDKTEKLDVAEKNIKVEKKEPVQKSTVKTPQTGAAVNTNRVPQTVTGGKWTVQIGAFSKRDGAEALVAKAREDGLSAVISSAKVDGKDFYRVRVAPYFKTREDAAGRASEIEQKGYPVSVFPAE